MHVPILPRFEQKKEGGDQKHRLIVGDKTVIEY